MASGYASGSTKQSVKAVCDELETSPSKTQPSSPVYGSGRQGMGAESAKGSVPAFKDKKGGRSEKGAT
jgi:hypothetical protein